MYPDGPRAVAIAVVCLLGVVGGAAAASGTLSGGDSEGQVRSIAGKSSRPHYVTLRDVGVKASGARIYGNRLHVRLRTRRHLTSLRFAVMRKGKIVASARSGNVGSGRFLFKRTLTTTPTGSQLKLRVTARVRRTRGRQFVSLKVFPPDLPAPPAAPPPAPPPPPPAPFNAAPTITTSAGSTAYTEGDPATVIDGALTVADPDDVNLESATVRVSSGFQSGDVLDFAAQSGITGSYNSGSGVLTLSGTATKANYQAALRSIQYRHTADNPAATKTIEFGVGDGQATSAAATKSLVIAAINDAPAVTTTVAALAYAENDGPRAIDGGLTVVDPDSPSLSGATIALSAGFTMAEDELAFSPQLGITGVYNDTTGVLTLSGIASPADYQIALRSVTYENVSNDPTTTQRTASFQVTDTGLLASSSATRDIAVSRVNDAPVLANAGTLNYTEGDAATAISSTLTVSDVDDTNLESASVSITTGQESDDDLSWVDNNGADSISLGSDNNSTDVLTLTGTGTLAEYEAALRAVRYENTGANPMGAKTIAFIANDGALDSAAANATVNITGQNDAPVVDLTDANLPYAEGAGPVAIDSNVTITDPDSAQLNRATIVISQDNVPAQDELGWSDNNGADNITLETDDDATGTLVLSGADTIANYKAAIQAVTYENVSQAPSPATRQLSVKARDSANLEGAADTRTIAITAANDAPVLTAGGTLNYNENDPPAVLDSTITITDDDDADMESATVAIGTGHASDDDLSWVDNNAADSITLGSDENSTDVLTLSGTGTKAEYEAALEAVRFENTGQNPSGSRSVAFTANDGSVDSNADTVTVNIASVNDAPAIDLNGAAAGTGNTVTFSEPVTQPGPGVVLAPVTEVSDPEDTHLESAEITLVNHPDGAAESLSVETTGTSIVASTYDDTTGVLTLTGHDTLDHYRDVLRTAKYNNTAATPNSANRTVQFKVNDGDVDSAVASATVQVVPLNDPPVLDLNGTAALGIDSAASFSEGGGPASMAPAAEVTDTNDANMESATITLTNRPDGGAESLSVITTGTSVVASAYNPADGTITLSGSRPKSEYAQVIQSATYDNSSDTPDTAARVVDFTVNDGQADSALAQSTVTVTATNDAPQVDLNGAGGGIDNSASFSEDGGAVDLASATLVSDADDSNLESATITLTNHPDGAAESLSISTAGTSITAGAYNSSTGVLALSGTDTVAHYQQVLRTATYDNSDQDPDTASRIVDFTVNDGDANSPVAHTTVSVGASNDAPVVDLNGGGPGIDSNAAFTEDSAPLNPGSGPVTLGASATASDADNANLSSATITLTNHPDGGAESLSVDTSGTSVTASAYNSTTGTITLSTSRPKSEYQQVIQTIKYNNTSNTPNTTDRIVDVKVNDGALDSAVAHSTIGVTATNDAPSADDETFNGADSAVGNSTFVGNDPSDGPPATSDPTDSAPATDRPHKTITGDILDGDSDPESSLTVTAGTVSSTDAPGANNVTLQADGDFTFEPEAGTSCTDHSDSFDYTVSDGSGGSDSGTVNIAIAGCVWYVNNNDAEGNDGTSEKPFSTLAQAETASLPANPSSIFVYEGSGTGGYDAGVDLDASQKLIGQAANLVVGSDTLHSADATRRPLITDSSGDVVALDDANEVRGLDIDPQGGGGIAGAAGDTGGGTIDDVNIVDGGTAGPQPGLELDATTGTFNISDLTVDNSAVSGGGTGSIGVRLNNAGTVNFLSAGTISITSTNGAKGLDAVSTNMGASVFDDITVTGSSTGGVNLVNTTGTTTLGDGAGTDLSLTTTSGSTPALNVSSAGTVSVPSGGTANLNATGGPAADITGTSGATFDLDAVSSTNSASDGINIDGLGAGSFSATGGSIGGASGISFDLNGGSGAVTYPGNLNNGSGTTAVDVSGRSAGAVSLSGSISDNNDAGGTINVTSNTGGSTTMSGPTKQANTGAGDGVAFTTSDGHTLTLSGGGLDIDTTSGKGVEATTSGTLNITGSSNTINTATGRALNIDTTDIGASDVRFQGISSNGASNGIRLNTTGSSGGLIVDSTGSGSCTSAGAAGCTGGAIQNSTGAGIELTNVGNDVSLTRMSVNGGGDDGIRATTVGSSAGNGVAVANSFVASNGNAVNENGIDYDNVLGISSINNTTSTLNGEFNARIDNDNGTGRFTVDSSTFSSNSSAFGADGLLLNGDGTGTVRALVQNSTFQANRDDGFQLLANGDSNMDLTFNNNQVHSAGNAGAVSAHAALNFDSNTTSDVKMSMTGGNVTASDVNAGSAIIVNPIGTTSTFDATFENITIGTAGVPGSGSATGQGFRVIPTQNTDSEIAIKNNNINGTSQFAALLRHNDGGGDSDFTFTGNTIRNVGSGNEPIFVQSGSLGGDTTDVCADIGGAGGDNTEPPGNDFAGQAAGGVTDIGFRRPAAAAGAHLRLPGFDGNPANLTSYIQNRNVGSPTVLNFSGALEAGPANCQQPTAPTAP